MNFSLIPPHHPPAESFGSCHWYKMIGLGDSKQKIYIFQVWILCLLSHVKKRWVVSPLEGELPPASAGPSIWARCQGSALRLVEGPQPTSAWLFPISTSQTDVLLLERDTDIYQHMETPRWRTRISCKAPVISNFRLLLIHLGWQQAILRLHVTPHEF